MDDKLEKFIKSNRAELDDKYPRQSLWSEIEGRVRVEPTQRKLNSSMIYWRAAAVILLLISSWLVFDKINHRSENHEEIAIANPQLLEAEGYYISLIDQKRVEIQSMSERFGLGNDFAQEVDRLDSMYTVLKQDMVKGDEENLVDAMILNLQLRIEILNQQLGIIKSIENSQRDETIIL